MKIFKNDIYKGGSIALFSKLLAAFFSYAMTIFVARSMSLDVSGLFFLSVTLVIIMASLVRLGTEVILLKRLAIYFTEKKISLANQVLFFFTRRIVLTAFITIILFSLGYLLFLEFYPQYFIYQQYYFAVLLSFLPISLVQLISFFFQAKRHMLPSNFLLSGTFPFFLIIYVYFFGINTDYFILKTFIASAYSALIFAYIVLFFNGAKFTRRENLIKDKKTLISESYSMYPIVIMNLFVTWMSQLLLALLSGPDEVSGFAVSQRTAMLIGFLILAANSITASKFSYLYSKGNYQGIEKTLFYSIRFVCFLAIPLMILIVTFLDEILMLFGSEYIEFKISFLLICCSQLFNVFTGSVGQLLQMSNNQNKVRLSILISLIINVVICIIMIPTYGALGAAIAYSTSFAIQNILCAFFVYRVFRINILSALSFKSF